MDKQIGTMKLTIVEAKLTHDTESMGKMDPYIKFKCREHQWKTSIMANAGEHPKWEKDNVWEFPVMELGGALHFTVMDEDATYDDKVGEGQANLSTFAAGGGIDEWYDIQYKGQKAGKIHLISAYTANE